MMFPSNFLVNWLFLLAVAIAKFAVFFLVLLVGKDAS